MGFFDNRRKKKDSKIKLDILKEINGINARDSEMMKRVQQLELTVQEHPITGAKDESKALEELLGYVQMVKKYVNDGSKSSANTWFSKADKFIADNWKTSNVKAKTIKEEEDVQFDLDHARDKKEKLLKKQAELRAYLEKYPEKQNDYAAEWNSLMDDIDAVQKAINDYTKEHIDENYIEKVQDDIKRTEKIEDRTKISDAKVEQMTQTIEDQKQRKEERDSAMDRLRGAASQSQGTTLRGFDQSSQSQATTLRGFNQTTTGATAGIDQAIKRVDMNLAKMESLKEDLTDQLSDKDREYKKIFKELRELLLKRKDMASAEYRTIDYKIDDLKINLQSVAKQKDVIQNKLAQTNLKMVMLNQLKLEKDLNVMNKYNIDEISMEDVAAYLSTKNTEKNDQLSDLDMLTQTILGDKVNSSTDVAANVDDDYSSLSGDKDRYADLEKMMGL